jgi:guanosine-3',5'-bis(diphosphate) 3'-pyrophosphohydrolase
MIRQFELVEAVKSYDRLVDEEALNRAYVFAMKAHGNQKRASGDPYFLHPLEVAGILTEYKLDTNSIITALLHDTIEDTEVTTEEVAEQFGEEVAQLVDGVTKLTQIELQSQQSDQAENFRKLVLAMSEDIRVLLVKLADRLHNMRTLGFIKSADKRRRIASETMDIYAPLAERIGMQEMKNELEDLSFAELNAEARDSIIARLQFLRDQGRDNVDAIIAELTETMRAQKLRTTVIGREKLPYSIWRKTQKKKVSFEQVADIMAFRVLVENAEDCYRALGIIHSAYSSVPGRFKDYISTPKSNGYQSLHTCVIGPAKQRIEIQIRTKDMHEVAELGVAAHWQYKHGLNHNHGRDYRWLRELLDILDHAASPDDFLEHTKLEMFADQVFCFTPAGEVIALPGGATPVDFAYAVHSEVGDTCVGAKINGRATPLRTELENGDQVEIITSGAQIPSPTWENFVVTGKARARIRRFIRLRQKEEYMTLGRAILERAFKQEDYRFNEALLGDVLAVFAVASAEDLAAEVGAGHLTGRQVLEAVYPGLKDVRREGKVIQLVKAMNLRRPKKTGGGEGIPIKGLIPGMALHFAACCNALPGDRIVGIVTKGRGVTIHTIDCETLEEFADMEERWIDVFWDADAIDEYHVARVELVVTNETGSLGELSTVIARGDGNITNLKITNRTTEFFDIMIDIQVRDVKHLTNIVAALRASPVINTVERARG